MTARGLTTLLLALLAASAPTGAFPASDPERDAVARLSAYLQIDTSNPPGAEGAAAEYLAAELNREGIATRRLVSPSGRTSLYARLQAERPDGSGALVLLHHIDVVPPGEGWTRRPFSGRVEGGRIWGRGAIDAKGLGVVQLEAFLMLARESARLARDVVYLAVADEEAGGLEGTRWLLDAHPELFAGVDAVLNEGGANRVVGGRLLWWGIEVVQKRPLWLRLSTRGRGGHASGFQPWSAAHHLIRALDRVLDLEQSDRVTEASLLYFGALAPYHPAGFADVFTQPTPEEATRRLHEAERPDTFLMPGMQAFLRDTIQITSLDTGSDSINVVPSTASATLDSRLLPDTDSALFLERLESAAGDEVEIEVLLSAPPQTPSPTDHGVFRTLERILGETAPVVPAFILGTTDSRYFRERGIPAYGFWPFLLDGRDNRGIHGPDESIPVAKFLAGVRLTQRVLRALALSEEPRMASGGVRGQDNEALLPQRSAIAHRVGPTVRPAAKPSQ